MQLFSYRPDPLSRPNKVQLIYSGKGWGRRGRADEESVMITASQARPGIKYSNVIYFLDVNASKCGNPRYDPPQGHLLMSKVTG